MLPTRPLSLTGRSVPRPVPTMLLLLLDLQQCGQPGARSPATGLSTPEVQLRPETGGHRGPVWIPQVLEGLQHFCPAMKYLTAYLYWVVRVYIYSAWEYHNKHHY